jgi:hypothetical protein
MQCGSRHGRTLTRNGYNCATTSRRETYRWPLRIGTTNGTLRIETTNETLRISSLTQEISTEREEEEVRQEHTHAEEVGQEQIQPTKVTVPKKPRTGQNKPQHKKGGTSKTRVQMRKKNNTQAPQV